MGKSSGTAPQGQLRIKVHGASGNQFQHSGAGVRTMDSTEEGGIFRLTEPLLKGILSGEDEALQALPTRSHGIRERSRNCHRRKYSHDRPQEKWFV